jgi:hypothetical protein
MRFNVSDSVVIALVAIFGTLLAAFLNWKKDRHVSARKLQTIEVARKYVEFWQLVQTAFPEAVSSDNIQRLHILRACRSVNTIPMNDEFVHLKAVQLLKWASLIAIRIPRNILRSAHFWIAAVVLVWYTRLFSQRFVLTLSKVKPDHLLTLTHNNDFWVVVVTLGSVCMCIAGVASIFKQDFLAVRPLTDVEQREKVQQDAFSSPIKQNKGVPPIFSTDVIDYVDRDFWAGGPLKDVEQREKVQQDAFSSSIKQNQDVSPTLSTDVVDVDYVDRDIEALYSVDVASSNETVIVPCRQEDK